MLLTGCDNGSSSAGSFQRRVFTSADWPKTITLLSADTCEIKFSDRRTDCSYVQDGDTLRIKTAKGTNVYKRTAEGLQDIDDAESIWLDEQHWAAEQAERDGAVRLAITDGPATIQGIWLVEQESQTMTDPASGAKTITFSPDGTLKDAYWHRWQFTKDGRLILETTTFGGGRKESFRLLRFSKERIEFSNTNQPSRYRNILVRR